MVTGPSGPTGPSVTGPTGGTGPTGTSLPSITAIYGENYRYTTAYGLLSIQTSAASWVRVYASNAAVTADRSRAQGTDPAPGSGLIAEVINTGANTQVISPGSIGFSSEAPAATNIPMAVTNNSGSTVSITVTLTLIQLAS